ncbi:HAD-IIA family hydrolase [Rathayibacter toxicus]|nr:HAD-IIA family hydrolase [Rathayibacter toxicus]PPI52176.1 haloacid dehalogenase [Rathayibacter toxicus]QOD10563.1 HAD-IIA family hydrolase [Rathayibacter toxicus]QWL31513.1 HAD-IIA family hydrolase [Rathayibacter toxicus]QWL33605.1 HAD-IIA family hydrolase [Rathayibacter toxicus]QWL35740.1 HAD-IIA family hydrolase [Rathayibacter toxicus]
MLRRSSTKAEPTPLDGRDALLVDLDGVVYRGAEAIPFAVKSLVCASESLRVGYITNNASRTDISVAGHLTTLGLAARPEDVVTSPQAAAVLLADMVSAGSTVLVVGGEGLSRELERGGFRVTRSAEDSPAAVVQGFAPTVGWEQLAEASFALHTGIPWIATNTDWTIPVERGIAPGNGTLVSAVHTAVGRLPVVAGKPERAIFDTATARFGSTNPLVLGDRLDTDIAGALAAGLDSAHVLTGVDRAKQLLAADAKQRPRYIFRDLRDLHLPYPATTVAKNGTHSVRSAKVRLEGNTVVILQTGNDETDLLRAACSVIWSSGRAIYGLTVPELLYLDRP